MSVERNWFKSVALSNFESIFLTSGKIIYPDGNILQIGVYTGDATCWIAENILAGNPKLKLYDVDTFSGSPEEEHEEIDFEKVEELYDSRIAALEVKSQIFKHKCTSDEFFDKLDQGVQFQFIYIDGHHFAEYVARDAFNSFRRLALGGIVAFDDYGYGVNLDEREKPSLAIDFFLKAYENQIEILISNYQVWVMKIDNL